MIKKLIILLVALALLLSACGYQVVEDAGSQDLYARAFSRSASAEGGEGFDIAALISRVWREFIEAITKPQVVPTPSPTPEPTPVPTPAPTPLTRGARGDEVKLLQTKLNEWGFMTAGADGIFGPVTEKAVVAIQEYLYALGKIERPEYSLRAEYKSGEVPDVATDLDPENYASEYIPDGVVSDELYQIIFASNFAIYRENLQSGSRGAEVKRLQTRLAALDYLSGAIDGQFGRGTKGALSYFQKRNGLTQTGIADLDTQMLLFSKLAKKSDKPAHIYYLEVSTTDQRVYAYEWYDGSYSKLVRTMKCSTGLNDTPTPKGTFSMAGQAGRWYYFSTYECWAQYAYRIYGPYLFHSVIYSEKDASTLRQSSVNNLGRKASHGCIRLSVEDAKWVYENCIAGTKVKVY